MNETFNERYIRINKWALVEESGCSDQKIRMGCLFSHGRKLPKGRSRRKTQQTQHFCIRSSTYISIDKAFDSQSKEPLKISEFEEFHFGGSLSARVPVCLRDPLCPLCIPKKSQNFRQKLSSKPSSFTSHQQSMNCALGPSTISLRNTRMPIMPTLVWLCH